MNSAMPPGDQRRQRLAQIERAAGAGDPGNPRLRKRALQRQQQRQLQHVLAERIIERRW